MLLAVWTKAQWTIGLAKYKEASCVSGQHQVGVIPRLAELPLRSSTIWIRRSALYWLGMLSCVWQIEPGFLWVRFSLFVQDPNKAHLHPKAQVWYSTFF